MKQPKTTMSATRPTKAPMHLGKPSSPKGVPLKVAATASTKKQVTGSPAQIAARAKFAASVKSGVWKKK